MPDDNLLQVQAISAFDDNYIWLLSKGHCAVVVDPGDAQPVIDVLKKKSLVLQAILITHHHADHIGGVAEILSWCEHHQGVQPTVYGPAREEISCVSESVMGGDVISIPHLDAHFKVLDVPGHTAGHIAFYLETLNQSDEKNLERHLFCGDTLFASGCGRLFEGTATQMAHSLNQFKLLPDDTWVHCAHEYTLSNIKFALAVEPHNVDLQNWQNKAQLLRNQGSPTLPTTLAHEKRVNPFLRCEEVSVIQSVVQQRALQSIDPISVFAELRSWKDTFRA